MAGPWEKYQKEPEQAGPWTKYKSAPSSRSAAVQAEKPQGGFLHDVAMGARSTLQGLGGLVGSFGGDAFNHYLVNPALRAVGLEGQQVLPYRDEASALADRLGLPKPQTSHERVMNDIAEALAGTGATLGIGGALNLGRSAHTAPSLRTAAADLLTDQPVLQAVSTGTGAAASSTARESGAGTGGQLAAALAGGLAPGAITAGVPAAIRGAVRGASGEKMGNAIADFAALGTTPSVGQATGNSGLQGLENLLAGGPTSAGVMSRFAQSQGDDIAQNLAARARALSPDPTPQNAGTAIEQGVSAFRNDVRQRRDQLYALVDQLVPVDMPVPLTNTQSLLSKLTAVDPAAPNISGAVIPNDITTLAENLSKDLALKPGANSLPYKALKEFRSDFGQGLFDFTLTPDASLAQRRDVYRALGNDIEAAVNAQGPAASGALSRANAYYKTTQGQLEQLERVVNKAGGPEKIYSAVMSGSAEGGTTIKRVMEAVPDDAKKALTAAVLNRMGRPTPAQAGMAAEQFSPSTFMTNWNRLSNEARTELFGHYGPGYAKDMDQIARVADNIKTGAKVFANPSGTAGKASAYTYGAALVGSLFTGGTPYLAGAGLMANGAARLLTNPRFVKWLARSTTAPVGSVLGGLGSLRNIANNTNDPELRDIATQLEKAAQEANNADDENDAANDKRKGQPSTTP